MNTYYLHNGIESSGPFTIDELKLKKISATTPVWSQGMSDWKTIGEVEELKSLLTVVPPPIKKVEIPSEPSQKIQPSKSSTRILGLKKNIFVLVCFLAVLIVASFAMNFYQENRRAAMELKNKQTEKNNIQYRLQQKEIEEQKIQLVIQEKIDAERALKEKKEAINNKLFTNQELLITANTNFENAKKKLADASNFQFFRSESERAEDIDQAQKEIAYWKKEIEKIENEKYQLKLELEKLH